MGEEAEHIPRKTDMTTIRILELKNIDKKSHKRKKSSIMKNMIQKMK